jgi:hypothetical protein
MSPSRSGAERSEVDYVWPTTIARPQTPTLVIYLDLNHWIGLAKAATSHPDGQRYCRALEAIRASQRNLVFPLGSVHYVEMAPITSPKQRSDVAAVMEELSGFASLLSGLDVMRLEIDAAVAQITGTPERHAPVELVGTGVLQAFGRRGGLRVYDSKTHNDVTEVTRAGWPSGSDAYDEWSRKADAELSRAVLRGPSDSEAADLQRTGWDPEAARRIAERRLAGELELVDILNHEDQWRRGRIRDVVSARYLANDATEILMEAAAARGVPLRDLCPTLESARRFSDGMPGADTYITLRTAAHRNAATRWRTNEIFDVDALSVAVPYCDVVVTEAHAHHVLTTARLPDRVGTKVFRTIDALVELLD